MAQPGFQPTSVMDVFTPPVLNRKLALIPSRRKRGVAVLLWTDIVYLMSICIYIVHLLLSVTGSTNTGTKKARAKWLKNGTTQALFVGLRSVVPLPEWPGTWHKSKHAKQHDNWMACKGQHSTSCFLFSSSPSGKVWPSMGPYLACVHI